MTSRDKFNDLQNACKRQKEVTPENGTRANELASHLLITALNDVKDRFEDLIDQHCGDDKAKAVLKALDVILKLYNGEDDNFDLYDYTPCDDGEKLVCYIVEKFCNI